MGTWTYRKSNTDFHRPPEARNDRPDGAGSAARSKDQRALGRQGLVTLAGRIHRFIPLRLDAFLQLSVESDPTFSKRNTQSFNNLPQVLSICHYADRNRPVQRVGSLGSSGKQLEAPSPMFRQGCRERQRQLGVCATIIHFTALAFGMGCKMAIMLQSGNEYIFAVLLRHSSTAGG